jgi:hypothetical protein
MGRCPILRAVRRSIVDLTCKDEIDRHRHFALGSLRQASAFNHELQGIADRIDNRGADLLSFGQA